MAQNYFEECNILSESITSLVVGAPGPDLLDLTCEIVKNATVHRLAQPHAYQLFQYGLSKGDEKFPEEVAKFLSQQYGDTVLSENIFGNAGATHGMETLASLLLNSGDTVFVEEPTYFLALDMLRDDMHLNLVPVQTDDEGMKTDLLEEAIKKHKANNKHQVTSMQPFWSIIYVIPTFNNPSGFCMSPERCKTVISLARKHQCLIVCDDVYNVLSYRSNDPDKFVAAPKRLFAYDNKSDPDYQGNVVSNGTFSKFFGPGLRVGWYEAPKSILKILFDSGYVQSGGGFNTFTSGVVTSALQTGMLAELVGRFRKEFHMRRDALYNAATEFMPEGVTFKKPQGGYFMWIELPQKINAVDLLKACKEEHQISFAVGPKFSSMGKYNNCIRLSFSYYNVSVLTNAVRKISSVVKRLI